MLREEIILRLVEIVAVAVNAMTCTSGRISPIFENSLRYDLPLYIDSREKERERERERVRESESECTASLYTYHLSMQCASSMINPIFGILVTETFLSTCNNP